MLHPILLQHNFSLTLDESFPVQQMQQVSQLASQHQQMLIFCTCEHPPSSIYCHKHSRTIHCQVLSGMLFACVRLRLDPFNKMQCLGLLVIQLYLAAWCTIANCLLSGPPEFGAVTPYLLGTWYHAIIYRFWGSNRPSNMCILNLDFPAVLTTLRFSRRTSMGTCLSSLFLACFDQHAVPELTCTCKKTEASLQEVL